MSRGPRVIVYSRPGCGLCQDMLEQLQHCLGRDFPIQVIDIERDAVLRERFAVKIPVLEVDGEVICFGHLDRARLEQVLGHFGVK